MSAEESRLEGNAAKTISEMPVNVATQYDRHPLGPHEIKVAAKELGVPRVTDLLVLGRGNDPYYIGTPAELRDARWFAELWEQFGYAHGVHLRRIHYQVFSVGGKTATGQPYLNTDKCWNDLLSASKAARILGLVDPEAFVDRRNAPPRLYIAPRSMPAIPEIEWAPPNEWELPRIPTYTMAGGYYLGDLTIEGYDYDPDDQPVVVEVHIEKTTMDDVLMPICYSLKANLLSGSGFQSITAVIQHLRRIEQHGKPTHIIYISDFDPAGGAMPISVARQAQFWIERLGIDVELTIHPVALTLAQVNEFELPRQPAKVDKNGKSDRRAARFEQVNGEGIVELDALEALHPGRLAELVQHAIQPYRDGDLRRSLMAAEHEAQQDCNQLWHDKTAPLRSRRAELQRDIEAVTTPYRQQLKGLAEKMARELQPYQERLDSLREDLTTAAEERLEVAVERIPDRPTPGIPEVDRSKMLYDSRRLWLDQLRAYQIGKGETALPAVQL